MSRTPAKTKAPNKAKSKAAPVVKSARRYSDKTLKLLFGKSGNQCAFPDCTHPTVALGTNLSDPAVLGQICHIYASADNGPRGKSGLTPKERDAEPNLIVMCGFHHPLVDQQHADYPADLLKTWKAEHEAKFQFGMPQAEKLAKSMQTHAYLQQLSDAEIVQEIERIRKARHLAGFETQQAALRLAERIEATQLAGSSNEARSKGLAWCARMLSQPENIDRANSLLNQASLLALSEDVQIARGAIAAIRDKAAALAIYAPLNSPTARTAALKTVNHIDGAEAALAWAEQCQLDLSAFDPDGKLVILFSQLNLGKWAEALETVGKLTPEDYEYAPVLEHGAAMAYMLSAVPEDLRSGLLRNLPFSSSDIPLADDGQSLDNRAKAIGHFERAATAFEALDVLPAANLNSDFALWLKLRSLPQREEGLAILKASLSEERHSLRRINLALQFNVNLDIPAVEAEIDRRIAFSGQVGVDEAWARFALAFTRTGAGNVAEYIEKYRSQLDTLIDRKSLLSMEVELLAKDGRTETANDKLNLLIADGLDDKKQGDLRRIIAEAAGADAVSERRITYEHSNTLIDLVHLVSALDEKNDRAQLLHYAKELFSRTRTAIDAARVASALSGIEDFDGLFDFLSTHQELVTQNLLLKTHWSWALYRAGEFEKSFIVLSELAAIREDVNDRALFVNLSIASGQWEKLAHFTTQEWTSRDSRTPEELLSAGKFAQVVGGPHAKDLVNEAAKRAENAEVLAGAYFYAVQAGWEESAVSGDWLTRASELSGEDGPLKRMTLKELLDLKPDWDKREADTLDMLRVGKLPMFATAFMLNRSLIDFVLLQPIANLKQHDARKRGVVYSYSGARNYGEQQPEIKKIALDLTAIFTFTRLGIFDLITSTYDAILIPHNTMIWLFKEYDKATFHQPSQIKNAHHLKRLISAGDFHVLPRSHQRDSVLSNEIGDDLAGLLWTAKSRTENGAIAYVIRSSPVHRVHSLMEDEADLTRFSDCLRSCHALISKLRNKGILTREEAQAAFSYLSLHENRWPDEPEISDAAELYLDDLSVSYLRTVGVLDKLKSAGFKIYITERESLEADRLIGLEGLTAEQVEIMSAVRASLAIAIKNGRVTASRSTITELVELQSDHPTWSVLAMSEHIDAIIVDDRSLNRHGRMQLKNTSVAVGTSLEILIDLKSRGAISQEQYFGHIIFLRKSGYQLIPITTEELLFQLQDVGFQDGQIIENAELRAVRESLLRARMTKIVQIPDELHWLQSALTSVANTIKTIWRDHSVLDEARAISNWLLKLYDIRGWAPSAIVGNERGFALYAMGAYLHALASPPQDATRVVRENYLTWVDEILAGVARTEPEIFEWLVARAKEMIVFCTAPETGEEGQL